MLHFRGPGGGCFFQAERASTSLCQVHRWFSGSFVLAFSRQDVTLAAHANRWGSAKSRADPPGSMPYVRLKPGSRPPTESNEDVESVTDEVLPP